MKIFPQSGHPRISPQHQMCNGQKNSKQDKTGQGLPPRLYRLQVSHEILKIYLKIFLKILIPRKNDGMTEIWNVRYE